MTVVPFTQGWTFRAAAVPNSEPVRLPHDAMISETRSADAASGNHGGFFPGGSYVYTKQWTVPSDTDRGRHSLLFEGVYGSTRVFVDGREVGCCDSGYREFATPLGDLVPGSDVTIEVRVDNHEVPNSRWYTGSGIYRPVWLESVGATRISRDGIAVTTRSIGAEANLEVGIDVTGTVSLETTVVVEFSYDGEVAARVKSAVQPDGRSRIPIAIPSARLWSAETPHLYDVKIDLAADGWTLDSRSIRTGIRTLQIDPRRGLLINGTSVLLRGACVHHDNGILGAATFAAAERRRVRILKANGYNAIRSSHNPLSRAFLDACDEFGLYVMDELTDVWFQPKTTYDTATRFEELWPDDARAMVAKNRNRPSVILHSIGNEIAESSTEAGIDAAHRISAFLKELDPTRPTTMAVNLLLNLMAAKGRNAFDRSDDPSAEKAPDKKATSTAANLVTAKLGRIMELVSRLPAADKVSRDAFATVDVAGYNYAYGRYRGDRKRYPERVMVGSESMPGDLPRIWRNVQAVPGVIGDFMWTGWDYLGESGIGTWTYGNEAGGLTKPFPALVAGSGAFDITGLAGAPALLAQAVWGQLEAPAIAVRPLDRSGERTNKTPWRTSDAIPSWSWRGLAARAEVEVYSDADEVQLILNGRPLGRKRAGAEAGFVTRFTTPYEPGELVAVGYVGGVESGRSSLRSAGDIQLRVRSEEATVSVDEEIAFVWIELADAEGVVDSASHDSLTVSVVGPAALIALGSADPAPLEVYVSATQNTYHGRALAVIRLTGELGQVSITAVGARHGSATTHLPVTESRITGVVLGHA